MLKKLKSFFLGVVKVFAQVPKIFSAIGKALVWWWRSLGLTGPWLLIFLGVVVFASVGLVRYQILMASLPSVEQPLEIYTLGGRAIVLSVFLLLAPLAIYRTRLTFWLGLVLLVWWNVVDGLLIPGGLDRWKLNRTEILVTLDGVQIVAQIAILLGLVIAIVMTVIQAVANYAKSLDEWVKNRSFELFGENVASDSRADAANRSVSLLAVFALIFSLFLPILGLILAYAARHDIAVSNGRRTGKDIAIAASIISWVSLFVLLLILLVIFLGAVLEIAALAFLFS